jgi:hypothetical protein
MARFFGEVGYAVDTVEDPPDSGIWVDKIEEFPYRGDIIRNTRQLENNDKINKDVIVSNSISIVSDQYAIDHFFKIKYVRWMGELWTVTTVEVRAPRLILNLGSIYNGPTS